MIEWIILLKLSWSSHLARLFNALSCSLNWKAPISIYVIRNEKSHLFNLEMYVLAVDLSCISINIYLLASDKQHEWVKMSLQKWRLSIAYWSNEDAPPGNSLVFFPRLWNLEMCSSLVQHVVAWCQTWTECTLTPCFKDCLPSYCRPRCSFWIEWQRVSILD